MPSSPGAAPVTQVTLPDQAAAPEGPVDLSPMFVMHHAFRRGLAAFAAAAAATPTEDRATWQALERRWRRFSLILHHHHAGEDAHIWPMLLAETDAAGDRDGRETLEAMAAEHEEIDPLLDSCASGFARLAQAADEDARAALGVRVVAAREQLGRHLGHEEREALALVQRYLSPAQWRELDKKVAAGYPPREIPFTLAWVLAGLQGEGLDRGVALIGRPMALVWRLVLRRWFERGEGLAFRYV